jgi:iron(III) transport system ATP-binding protein
MSKVTLKNLSKSFGQVVAVENLNLEIQQGEFFSLLGPSGCGKTTTLRIIAGFDFPTTGKIFFDEKDVTFLSTNRRNTGMVFQNYALFPHMTVFENVAFGLQARRVVRSEIKRRVRVALRLVELADYENRKVTELSGGQQQRVAIARAIVIEPVILLLDEPLSNLDAKLRQETREELRALQRRLGITTIYVTHDQEEALALSDRLAVLNAGVCLQVGTPQEIYQRPRDRFIASFVGHSNILEGEIVDIARDTAAAQITPNWQIRFDLNGQHSFSGGESVTLGIRPENIKLTNSLDTCANVFDGVIKNMSYAGAFADFQIEVNGQLLRVKSLASDSGIHRAGERVRIAILPAHVSVLTR